MYKIDTEKQSNDTKFFTINKNAITQMRIEGLKWVNHSANASSGSNKRFQKHTNF